MLVYSHLNRFSRILSTAGKDHSSPAEYPANRCRSSRCYVARAWTLLLLLIFLQNELCVWNSLCSKCSKQVNKNLFIVCERGKMAFSLVVQNDKLSNGNYIGISGIYKCYKPGDIASFPGPAQLSVAFSMEKWERAWYLFSRE